VLTVAAIMAAAGIVAALVVARPGGGRQGPQLIGDGSGTVTLEPALVQPRVSGTTVAPSSTGLGVNVGSVGGLYPGHRVEVGVTYVNPYSFPIAIDTVRVHATGTTRCTARHLLPATTARVPVPARSALGSTLEVGMRKSAPDACQGVRFALRVQVTAVRL
jgi:hypothetical protein